MRTFVLILILCHFPSNQPCWREKKKTSVKPLSYSLVLILNEWWERLKKKKRIQSGTVEKTKCKQMSVPDRSSYHISICRGQPWSLCNSTQKLKSSLQSHLHVEQLTVWNWLVSTLCLPHWTEQIETSKLESWDMTKCWESSELHTVDSQLSAYDILWLNY